MLSSDFTQTIVTKKVAFGYFSPLLFQVSSIRISPGTYSQTLTQGWVAPLDNIKGSFRIVYIPGFAGINYNEAADHLAGIAVPIG